MLFFLKRKERLWSYLHAMSHESWRTDFLQVMYSWIMTQDQNKDGKYSFIIYWTIAQKLIIMNQTTNFTILSRIWNHDFYITQKSNFCTAGHKYLNKRVLRKNIFFKQVFILNSSGSPRRLKQFWCDFPQASLVVLPIWQNTKVNRETIIINGKLNRIKKKQTKKIYLFTLVPVVQLVAC